MLNRVVISRKYMMLLIYVICIHCGKYVLAWTSEERAHAGQMWVATQMLYKEVTGKEGEYEDLVGSLRNPQVTEKWKESLSIERIGRESPLVEYNPSNIVYKATLNMLLYSQKEHRELLQDITQVYKVSRHWGVRLLCAELAERYGSRSAVSIFVRDVSRRMEEFIEVKRGSMEEDELNTALSTLTSIGITYNYPDLTNVINRCYIANHDIHAGIRFPLAMERYNKELAQKYWVDYAIGGHSGDIHMRLVKAEELFSRGDLRVYPVLQEGLTSLETCVYGKAVALRENFRKHNGAVFNEEGEIINLKELNDKCASTNDLVRVHVQRNVDSWKIPYNAEKLKAYRTSKIENDRLAIWERLHYADVFLDNGWLTGYSILHEGLSSPDEYARSKAGELLERYRAFDGQTCPDTGIKIDVDSILNEIKSTK